MSRDDVAAQTNVPAKAQARLERGEVMSSKYLPALTAFYGLDVEDSGATVVALSTDDPPLSRTNFAQAWLRVMELWLESRSGTANAADVVSGHPPPPQVMDALNTIKVNLAGDDARLPKDDASQT